MNEENENFIKTEDLPPEVQQYEKDVLSGKVKVEDTDRNKRWIRGLRETKRVERTEKRNQQLKNAGEFVVSLIKPVEVTASAPTTQKSSKNNDKRFYLILAGVVVACLILIK